MKDEPQNPERENSDRDDLAQSARTVLDDSQSLSSGNTNRPPPVIPDHELLRPIGRGAYGEVWLAQNIMGSYRAVKIVYRDAFESEKPYNREFSGIQKFEPVSRTHESQVDILHVGRSDKEECFFYVMELADDEMTGSKIDPEKYVPHTVRSDLKLGKRCSPKDALGISLALTTALRHLHTNGLIHRDVKPANIIFVNGRPKLADIGLVAESDGPVSFVGTEGYLPPEGPGSEQADIFSLGKTLYELVTGKDRLEFPELPTLVESPELERSLFEFNEILLKACHNDIRKRYQSADEMHQDVLLLQAGKSVRRSRKLEARLALLSKAAAVFVLVTVLAAVGYFYQQAQTREARRLALENSELAIKERTQRELAETAVALGEMQRIEGLFEAGKSGQAIALLAHRLREDPDDKHAARRLLAAMTYRDFSLPLANLYHESKIQSADVSHDGNYLATGTGSGDLFLWDLNTFQSLGRVHVGQMTWSVHFSPDGSRLVTPGGKSNQAGIWSVTNELSLLQELPHGAEVTHAEFDFSGTRVLTTTAEGTAHVWNVASGKMEKTLLHPATDNAVVYGQFAPDGQRIITSTWRSIYVWDSQSGDLINRLADPLYWRGISRQWKRPFEIRPFETQIAYLKTGKPAFLNVWDYETGEIRSSRQFHEHPIGSVAFSPDGRLVASGSNDQGIRLWDLANSTFPAARHEMLQPGVTSAIAFHPNGAWIATGSSDATIQLWDVDTGQPIGEPIQHLGNVRYLEFLSDGTRLLSLNPGEAIVWDVLPGGASPNLLVHELKGDGGNYVDTVQFTQDGENLLTSLSRGTRGGGFSRNREGLGLESLYVQAWSSRRGEPVSPRINKSALAVSPVRMTRDGRFVMNAAGGDAVVLNVKTGEVQKLGGHVGTVDVFDMSEDGHWAFSKSYSRATKEADAFVWNLQTGERNFELNDAGSIIGARFSPDGSRLFTVTRNDTSAGLWDVETGKIVARIQGIRSTKSFEFSSDSRSLVYGVGGHARVYSTDSGEPLSDWFTHDHRILDVQFSSDGSHLLTGSFDQTAKLWDVGTGRQMIPDLSHGWLINKVDFGSDDAQLATGSWDKTARLWNRDNGLPLADPFVHPDFVISLDMHPSGQWLATGAADGVGRIWELPMPDIPAPDWFLDVVELIVGYRITELGKMERMFDQRRQLVSTDRFRQGDRETANDAFTGWARWFFADRSDRTISPFSDIRMETHHQRLLKIDTVYPADSLNTLLRHKPMDWQTLSRLAHKLSLPESGNQALGADRADWLTQLATRTAPDEALCWWVRAETLLALNRYEEALRAVQRSLVLEPSGPNALFIKALILQETGSSTEAYDTFKIAVQSVHGLQENDQVAPTRYLMEMLQLVRSTDLSETEHLERWVNFSKQLDTENSRVSQVTEWLTSMSLEQRLAQGTDSITR